MRTTYYVTRWNIASKKKKKIQKFLRWTGVKKEFKGKLHVIGYDCRPLKSSLESDFY